MKKPTDIIFMCQRKSTNFRRGSLFLYRYPVVKLEPPCKWSLLFLLLTSVLDVSRFFFTHLQGVFVFLKINLEHFQGQKSACSNCFMRQSFQNEYPKGKYSSYIFWKKQICKDAVICAQSKKCSILRVVIFLLPLSFHVQPGLIKSHVFSYLKTPSEFLSPDI